MIYYKFAEENVHKKGGMKMLDKMKKTLFPILLVALIFALTLGTVVLAAADFTIGGADGSSYGLILEKKIGSDTHQ